MELDDVWVLHLLQHFQLIVDHLLVATNVLLQDDLDCNFAIWAIGLTNDTVRSSTQCLPELVARPVVTCLVYDCVSGAFARHGLAVVAVGLAMQLVEHVCHFDGKSVTA